MSKKTHKMGEILPWEPPDPEKPIPKIVTLDVPPDGVFLISPGGVAFDDSEAEVSFESERVPGAVRFSMEITGLKLHVDPNKIAKIIMGPKR